MWIGFVAVVWITLLGLTSDVLAQNITLRKARPKGVACKIVVTDTEGIDPSNFKISCRVGPPSEEGESALTSGTPGIAACRAPGSKEVQLTEVALAGTFVQSDPVKQENCRGKDDDDKDEVKGNVVKGKDEDEDEGKTEKCKQKVVALPTPEQLGALSSQCENPGSTVLDFAPCSMTIRVKATGDCGVEQQVQAEATYNCDLLNCQAEMKFNKKKGALVGPDYRCTLIPESVVSGCGYSD